MRRETWTLEKEFKFEAAHQLPKHDGKCARLHGHSWKGKLMVSSGELVKDGPKSGMVMDYSDIKRAIEPLLERALDHHNLNLTTGLNDPTSEELARWIYHEIKPLLPLLREVRIEETCTSAATYREDAISDDQQSP